MAISIDTVYQRVLALANKEQRGYITPQEFNLFANQAQMEIFEQYFYDLNQAARIPGNEYVYSDVDDMLEEKLQIHQDQVFVGGGGNIPAHVYRIFRVEKAGVNCDILKTKDFEDAITGGYLIKPTPKRPIANMRGNTLRVSNGVVSNSGTIFYFKKPAKVEWGYFVINDKALYDSSADKTIDFQLHQSEETELVYKILKFAGISMSKIDIMRAGQVQEQSQVQQEKQ